MVYLNCDGELDGTIARVPGAGGTILMKRTPVPGGFGDVEAASGFEPLDPGTYIARRTTEEVMSLVRLLGFTTLGCGCVVGRYREVATSREVVYVEEKGKGCGSHGHRRNHLHSQLQAAISVDH